MKKITFLMVCLLSITFAQAQLNTLAIVGSGTAQGWPSDPQVDAHQMATADFEHWTLDNFPVLNGAVKFRGNNSWALPYNWGGNAFPSGTAIVDGAGITAAPGVYDITFNSTTGAYSFVLQTGVFPVIGLIGTATAGGWDVDTDMATTDGIHYSIEGVSLIVGAIKFRQDHTWTPTTNWGGNDFPSGTGIVDGAAISVPSDGLYNVTFNKTTLQYDFSFPTIAIVGDATPNGWPLNTPGEIDPHVLSTTDGITYTLASLAMTTGAEGAKFRANNSWTKNWGSNDFPTGVGVQGGGNILVTVGTYGITFNQVTGAYNFGAPLATEGFVKSSFKVFPNPTANKWNFAADVKIESINVFDVMGKIVLTATPKMNETNVDASALHAGIYFAQIATAKSTETVKLIKR